jgi:hypothetical protein
MTRPVTALRAKFAAATPALRAAAAEVWRLPGVRARYPRYLRTMHGVLRASVPLMELAARRCADLGARDPVAGRLATYLDEHIAEERGHDDWLLADLAALGCAFPGPATAPPPPVVARLVGVQYYWVAHYHPVALLGYIAVMEGNAPSTRLADWLVSAGVPAPAVRTVRAHADLDSGHTDAVFDLIDSLPLTAAHEASIAVSGLHTANALMGLFAHLARASPRRVTSSPHGGSRR